MKVWQFGGVLNSVRFMLLTIAIPTYNRPGSLRDIILKLESLIDNNQIEINVHDNSNKQIQALNRITCGNVNYFANSNNVGYAGNIKKCIENASGKYIWLLSDDDFYIDKQVIGVIDFLQDFENPMLAIQFSCSNNIINTFGLTRCNNIIKFIDSIESIKLDLFSHLSSLICSTEIMKKGVRTVSENDINNDYFHIICLLYGVNDDDIIELYESAPVYIYNSTSVRFQLTSLYQSKVELQSLIYDKFNVKFNDYGLQHQISKWLFFSGFQNYHVIQDRSDFLRYALKNKLIYFVFSTVLSYMPLLIRNFIYKAYLILLRKKSN